MRIEIADLEENTVKLTIPVLGKNQEILESNKRNSTDHYITANKPNNYKLGTTNVYFPANTFYEDFYLNLEHQSDTVMIHDNSVPAHRKFTVSFDVSKYRDEELKHMFIARLDKKGKPNYMPTFKRGSQFTTKTRHLGTYTLAKDTIPPKIRPKNFKNKQWLTNYRYLSLHISDDLSGVESYEATLNGEWILMEYEPKKRTITYNFDDKILDQKQCELKVVVTDNVGNATTFNSSFYRN